MVNIKKIAILSLVSVCIAMYGAADDGWIVVGSRTPSSAKIPKSKKNNKKHNSNVNAAHIPSLVYKHAPGKPKTLPHKSLPHTYSYRYLGKEFFVPKTPPSKQNSCKVLLHLAALHNDSDEIEHLIAEGTHICELDTSGATALHWAAGAGNIEAIKSILNNKDGIACIGIQDNEGRTPLHRAARIASNAILTLLEKTPKEFVDLRDMYGSTALLWATSCGQIHAVKALLKKGANIDAQDDVRGRTAVHWALRMSEGSTEKQGELMPAKTSHAIIRHLIACNADITIKDKSGWTAGDWAHQLGRHSEIALLKNKSAPSQIRTH